METSALADLARLAREAARTGGRIIRNRIDSVRTIETKASIRDLVTDVDREVEDTLRGFFALRTPSFGWLGEEGSYVDGRPPVGSEPRWIVDPIDGTTNFANGVPLCCVSIALYQREKALLGSVYDPFRQELFEAQVGRGATLNDKPIRVQSTNNLANAFLATGFPDVDCGPTANLRFMEAVMPSVGKVRAFGTAAIELAYVAAGRLTGFWELSLSPWDTAAGVVLVREAGGAVTNLAGESYSLDSLSIVATNGLIHKSVVEILANVAAESNC